MTGAASDPQGWQAHIGEPPKARRELIAKRAKDPKDPLKLVIVRDMWLTGFDAPCMHTMYVDKPMKGHGLMQAIARVNRVFRDKPAGLVVDYIGIAQNLKSALGQYSNGDRDQTGIDEAEAVRVLMEKYEIVRVIFRPETKGGFDYRSALNTAATPQARLAIMAGAIDWVLTVQQTGRCQGDDRGGQETRAPAVCGRGGCALQGIRTSGRKRRGTRNTGRGWLLPSYPRRSSQERSRRRQEKHRRAGTGDTANRQPCGRLDRNR